MGVGGALARGACAPPGGRRLRVAGAGRTRRAAASASSAAATPATAGDKKASAAFVRRLYRSAGAEEEDSSRVLLAAAKTAGAPVSAVVAESCFNVELSAPLDAAEEETLRWLLRETFDPEGLQVTSQLTPTAGAAVVEVGPRSNFATPWCTNAVRPRTPSRM